MPSNEPIRTLCGQEDERSTNRRRRKQNTKREAPRQRAGIRNSGTLMGDKHTHVGKPSYLSNLSYTSPQQITRKPHISNTDNKDIHLHRARHTPGRGFCKQTVGGWGITAAAGGGFLRVWNLRGTGIPSVKLCQ